jgi:hypothetical protein
LIPFPEASPSSLKKQTVEELLKIQQTYFPHSVSKEKTTKKALLETLMASFETKCFQPLVQPKEKTSNNTDLVSIGKNMKHMLNQIEGIREITHVIIENQISPIANRMKTVQGMLAQYFIMNDSAIQIEFISSSNKLKYFVRPIKEEPVKQKQSYKQNKQHGILYCSQLLESNESFHSWKPVLQTSKKDDLSDCFLQGIWYLQHTKRILCAENLKINSI